jgi:hypothetical protein
MIDYKVFLDMDDTLVATSPYIQKKFDYANFWIHIEHKTKSIKDRMKDLWLWVYLAINYKILEGLQPKVGYGDLYHVATVLDSQPKILTAVPEIFTKKSHTAKKTWLKKYLPEIKNEHVHITRSRYKHTYIDTNPNEIYVLVDDNPRICQRWENAGGIAIHIKAENSQEAVSDTIQKLHLLQQLKLEGLGKLEIIERFKLYK